MTQIYHTLEDGRIFEIRNRIGREPSDPKDGSGKLCRAVALCGAIFVAALCTLVLSVNSPRLSASPLGAAPTVTAVSPTEAYNYQATTVTITGTNFTATPTVTLGIMPLTDVTFVSSTTLTATVPADLPGGSYMLTVTNTDGQSASLDDALTVLLGLDGVLGDWEIVNSMTTTRYGLAAVATGGYIYALGGSTSFGGYLSSVERALINPDGSLGPWQATTPMTKTRYGLAAVAVDDYIYVLGGKDYYGCGFDTVERAPINPDGSLGPWEIISTMNWPRHSFAAYVVNNRIYVFGGSSQLESPSDPPPPCMDSTGQRRVEWAAINPDGSLGTWQISPNFVPFYHELFSGAYAQAGGHLYALGGSDWGGTYQKHVYQGAISPNGDVGPWQQTTSMSTSRTRKPGAISTGGYLYAIGGFNASDFALSSTERAVINTDGSLGPWQDMTSMTVARNQIAAVVVGEYLYVLGGWTEVSGSVLGSVERVAISPPSLDGITPSVVPADRPTTITITGVNFRPTPSVQVGEAINLDVSFMSSSALTATIPAGLARGYYTMTLATPGGQMASLSNALRVDDTIPTAHDLTINGGALNTTSINVTLTVSASDPTDGVAEMSFSNDGSTWGSWQPYATNASWSLTSGDDLKTVYGHFRDTAGNVSSVISDTIALDTTAPTDYGLTINEGALFTNKVTVTLTIGAQPGTAQMQVSNDGGFAGAEWEPYASRKAWEITQYGSYVIPRVVYVRYKDYNGNVSATYQDDIILDVTAPTGSVEAVARVSSSNLSTAVVEATAIRAAPVNPTDSYSYTIYLPIVLTGPANVTLYLQAEDDVSGVADMMISHLSSFDCARWEPYATTKAWYAPEEATTVYVKFRDHAGNVSEVVTDTITW